MKDTKAVPMTLGDHPIGTKFLLHENCLAMKVSRPHYYYEDESKVYLMVVSTGAVFEYARTLPLASVESKQ